MASRDRFKTRNEVVQDALSSIGVGSSTTDMFATLAEQLRSLEQINQARAEIAQGNAATRQQSASVNTPGESSTASTMGNALQGALGFGLGLSPLISGLVSLFGGGGGSDQPAPLVPFAKPLAINVDAGFSAAVPGKTFAVDSTQGGTPRPVTSGAPPQITVQVQAMDSRSFLDHSQDIAMAVRQAMLESGTLNDVIREA